MLKIVQILISPDDAAYQGALLGLGSDGVVYRADNDSSWKEYFPSRFSHEKAETACSETQVERERRIKICREVAARYPIDIFPENGESIDCKSAQMVRIMAANIEREIAKPDKIEK